MAKIQLNSENPILFQSFSIRHIRKQEAEHVPRLFESAICKRSVFQFSLDEIAVQVRDVDDGLVLRALSLASAGVGAVTEAQLVHLAQHGLSTAQSLGLALWQQVELCDLR